LDAFAGTTALRVRFVFVSDTDAVTDDGVYLDDIRIYGAEDSVPEQREVIVENSDFFGDVTPPPAFATTGAWNWVLGGKSRAPKIDARLAAWATPGTSGVTARFTPLITTPGMYEVFTTWGVFADSDTLVSVTSTTGTATVQVAQSQAGRDLWRSLGVYEFPYGQDPDDSNIRLSPTFPSLADVNAAVEAFVVCVKLATVTARAARGG
jgi:hypothetical protein